MLEFVQSKFQIICFLAWIILVGLVGRWIYLRIWTNRFKKIFAFVPEDSQNAYPIQQAKVDGILSRLARRLNNCLEEEKKIIEPYLQGKTASTRSPNEDLERYNESRALCQWLEKRFKRAHKATRIMRFRVKKYKKYFCS